MREKLKAIENQRDKFTAEFAKYGIKRGWKGRILKTLLLRNIMDCNGEIVAGHLWFTCTKQFADLGELKDGDRIEFCARSASYEKGYKGYDEERRWGNPVSVDYRLKFPSKVRLINQQEEGLFNGYYQNL